MRSNSNICARGSNWICGLSRAQNGIAVVEFALCLPFVLVATLTAAELANYTVTKMRVSQLALRLADDGSRIGTGDLLSTKQITEAQINDLMTGADLQGRSEEHTSELQALMRSAYAAFRLKKKKQERKHMSSKT